MRLQFLEPEANKNCLVEFDPHTNWCALGCLQLVWGFNSQLSLMFVPIYRDSISDVLIKGGE